MLTTVRERLREIAVRAGLAGVPEPVILLVAAIVLVICALAAVRAVQAGAAGSPSVSVGASAAPASSDTGSGASQDAPGAASSESTVVVHVAGEVRRPGLYRLAAGSRAADAIAAAGGALPGADCSAINLARRLADSEQLIVPAAGTPVAGTSARQSTGGGGAGQGAAPTPAAAATVDLNTADEAALDALPGVGPATAKRIVEDRDTNGPFKTVEDLMRVSGIGPKKFDSLKDLVTVR